MSLLLIIGCPKKTVDEAALIEKEGVKYLPNSEEPFNGEVEIYYSNGEKKYTEIYINGEIEKINTNKETEELTKSNNDTTKDNVEESIDIDATGKSEKIIKYYNNDRIKLKGFKENGKYWGDFTEWYENGKIKSKKKYIDGNLTKSYNTYHKNGGPKESWNYKNNCKNGPYHKWHYNGKKEIKGHYYNNLKDSLWTYWDKKGEKVKVIPYENDRINGKYTKYLNNGIIELYRHYRNGVPRDRWGLSDTLSSNDLRTIFEFSQKLLNEEEITTAMRLLNSIMEKYNFNDNVIISKIHLKIADVYNHKIHDYDRAIMEYTKIIENYQNTKEQPLALYSIIRIYKCKLSSGDLEVISRNKFLNMFPGHEMSYTFNNDCIED